MTQRTEQTVTTQEQGTEQVQGWVQTSDKRWAHATLEYLAVYQDGHGQWFATVDGETAEKGHATREEAQQYGEALCSDLLAAQEQGEEQGTPEAPAEPGKPDLDAEQMAAKLAAEQAAAEQQEQEQREQCQAILKGVVKAYRGGEKAYRDGLLKAGGLCRDYIGMRLTLGDARPSAVQAIEGRLAEYASDRVDVNRLVRCHAAWSLLCQQQAAAAADTLPALKLALEQAQATVLPDGTLDVLVRATAVKQATATLKAAEQVAGLVDAAKDVPYGHYRDAWCGLVERYESQLGECYRLLPGVEADCREAYRQAVAGGWGKEAAITKCQAIKHAAATLAAAKAKEQAAAKADEQAKAKAEQEQAKAAEQAAEAKLAASRQAEAAAKAAGDAAAQEQAKAQAEADRQAKEQARREREAADHAAQQADRDAARAKAEAQARAKAESEAEAKRATAQQKAAKRAAAKADKADDDADETPATVAAPTAPTAPECRAEHLVKAAKAGTPKDTADMLALAISGHDQPDDVAIALLRALAHCPELSKPTQRAMQAALVLLANPAKAKEQPADLAAAKAVQEPAVAAALAVAELKPLTAAQHAAINSPDADTVAAWELCECYTKATPEEKASLLAITPELLSFGETLEALPELAEGLTAAEFLAMHAESMADRAEPVAA